MKDGPALPASPRQVGVVGVLALGILVLTVGLWAVGPGHLWGGNTWPDYVAMFFACASILGSGADLAARDASGAWSWRRLRARSFATCGVSLVLLFVLSGIDPVESGISPVMDSAQGFATFTFLGCLVVATTAAVKTPRRVPDTAPALGTWPSAVSRTATQRLALRRLPVLSRKSYVDVDLSGLTIVIPRVFGGRGRWFIPVREVGVVLPPRPADSPHQFSAEEEPWVTRDEFQVPYLSTTSPLAPPNLLLLFTVPQEVPPIRWTASQDLGLSRRANRAGEGVTVDGVGLRVVDPAVARRVLLAVGAQAVTDVDAFVDRHRDVVRGPEEVRSAVTTERRTRIVSVCVWVVMVTCFTASAVTDDDRYGLVLIAVVLAGGVVRWLTRRSRRS